MLQMTLYLLHVGYTHLMIFINSNIYCGMYMWSVYMVWVYMVWEVYWLYSKVYMVSKVYIYGMQGILVIQGIYSARYKQQL